MSSYSVFFKPDKVYEVSLKALQRRKFELVSSDENKGIILAKKRGSWNKPEVKLEIQIKPVDDKQTKVDVLSKVKKTWFSRKGEDEVEDKFFRTLFNCFDHF